MSKRFNDTGVCIPEKHYMADITDKINKTLKLINEESYFVINRPRQYGKTTILYLLSKVLNSGNDYLAINISFEGYSEKIWSGEGIFARTFIKHIADELSFLNYKEIEVFIQEELSNVDNMNKLSDLITDIVCKIWDQLTLKPVLMIDEVDHASNNQMFLCFLGMLRNKYLRRSMGRDHTFNTVILAGVHDIKSLKLKLRPEESISYNSPWNIATDFTADLSFSAGEIATMLREYVTHKQVKIDIEDISDMLYYYTSGYPFLVSKLCKIMDEEITEVSRADWSRAALLEAVNIILTKDNTNFDTLIKNIENNRELHDLVFDIVINGSRKFYIKDDPIINIGAMYGIFENNNNRLKIHNRIYEQRIYNYMTSIISRAAPISDYNSSEKFLKDNDLDLEAILLKFQEFMKHQYSKKDNDFLERNGRLLFLAFLRPIINGVGFDFKEVQISEEKRLDVVITFKENKYIVELKKWYGPAAHQDGLDQLADYLDRQSLSKGYLIIFDTTEKGLKEWTSVCIEHKGKTIFAVRV